MALRLYAVGLLLAWVNLACVSTGPSESRLAEITNAHEDDDLETFYRVSEQLVTDYPKHPSSDKIRYDWALQLVSQNLNQPQSVDANRARQLLEHVYRHGHEKFDRFMSGLVLMKFAPPNHAQSLAAELLREFADYEKLNQVYYWLIQDGINRKELRQSASYVKALKDQFPKDRYLDDYMPILRRADLVGKTFPFPAEYAALFDGKYVLIDFWATFCEPCIEALPRLKTLQKTLSKRDFSIFGISIDDEVSVYEAFVKSNAFSWPSIVVGSENQALAAQVGVVMIPSYFILSPQGEVLETELELDEALDYLRGRINR